MHIYFSGIGGTAIGPLALIAQQAGYEVSGSDKQDSEYIEYLRSKGLDNIHIGQTPEAIADMHRRNPIDWIVFSSAVLIEHPDHPEFIFAREQSIRISKRDELLNEIIKTKNQKLIAIAGTHGKTTTTAMVIWLFQKLGIPVSYSVGAKIPFGDMGHFDDQSEYFVYECDEYDRNFLSFQPYLSAITGIAHDHHDIYPTEEDYFQAFRDFTGQSRRNILWDQDLQKLRISDNENIFVLANGDTAVEQITLPGQVNRLDGWLAVQTVHELTQAPISKLIESINEFPGVARRFEKIVENLYSDYAHTPEKIAACLQNAQEFCTKNNIKNLIVIYEPLTNKRQYHMVEAYAHLFDSVHKLYWVPSYLTREDPGQPILTPHELIEHMSKPQTAESSELDKKLKAIIQAHLKAGDLVVCISGGGGKSLDEWLRQEFI